LGRFAAAYDASSRLITALRSASLRFGPPFCLLYVAALCELAAAARDAALMALSAELADGLGGYFVEARQVAEAARKMGDEIGEDINSFLNLEAIELMA
jgi:hypothetical protein